MKLLAGALRVPRVRQLEVAALEETLAKRLQSWSRALLQEMMTLPGAVESLSEEAATALLNTLLPLLLSDLREAETGVDQELARVLHAGLWTLLQEALEGRSVGE